MAAYEPSAPPAPVYTSFPMYVSTVPQSALSPEIRHIHDWLIWSIINTFIGLGAGLLPLTFSIMCQMNKGRNSVQGARLLGTLALIFNIIVTIIIIFGWIGLLIWIRSLVTK